MASSAGLRSRPKQQAPHTPLACSPRTPGGSTSSTPPRAAAAAAAAEPTADADATALPTSAAVLIVGGGPAGLAAALHLSARGWRDVVVLEKRDSVEYADADR